jgi:hypothetical protein
VLCKAASNGVPLQQALLNLGRVGWQSLILLVALRPYFHAVLERTIAVLVELAPFFEQLLIHKELEQLFTDKMVGRSTHFPWQRWTVSSQKQHAN